jgi:hypothetical protein
MIKGPFALWLCEFRPHPFERHCRRCEGSIA